MLKSDCLPEVIQEMAEIYSEGIPLLKIYEGSIVKLYTMGYCSHLAHLLKLFCRKNDIDCRIGWIVNTPSKVFSAFDANHIGCVIEDKWYDIEYPNGLYLRDKDNLRELLVKWGSYRIKLFEEDEDDGFDENSFESFASTSHLDSFEKIVDFVHDKKTKEVVK